MKQILVQCISLPLYFLSMPFMMVGTLLLWAAEQVERWADI